MSALPSRPRQHLWPSASLTILGTVLAALIGSRGPSSAFYPGWAAMFAQVSRERGFPPPTRRQFDATRGPDGAFFVGDPDTVAAKCLRVSEQLGGVERINLQMTNPRLRHADLLHSIELLGTGVVPLVKS